MNETAINWTELTWNPMSGCSVVSTECKNCYAMQIAENKRGTRAFPAGFDLTLRPHKLVEPARVKKPSLIFCNSMSDFGLGALSDDYRDRILDAIEAAPRHRYQILTKRPENVLRYLKSRGRTLPSSVWMGVTTGHASTAWRLSILKTIPASVRFASVEPLLSSMKAASFDGIDWVIGGGESGCHLSDPTMARQRALVERGPSNGRRWVPRDDRYHWATELRDSVKRTGSAFWWKQWGGPTPTSGGRVLEGRTWDELPIHVNGAMPEGYLHAERQRRHLDLLA